MQKNVNSVEIITKQRKTLVVCKKCHNEIHKTRG
ncbi:hypothetical protein ACO11K_003501 [Bacillus cytotoxicus]